MGRAPCCGKVGLKRGRWTAEEDKILTNYILINGEGSWRSLPGNAGLLRCGKSCRLRWINYLRAGLKRGNITKEEEELIVKLHSALGNRWSLIAAQLPGRTDNEIKNYWNSHLSRKIYTYMRSKKFSNNNVAAAAPLPPPPPSSHSHTIINIANLNNKNQAATAINHLPSSSYLKNRSLLMSNKYTVVSSSTMSTGLVSKEPAKHLNIARNKNINPNQWSPVNNYERTENECSNLGPYEWLDSEVTRLRFILQSEDINNGDSVMMTNNHNGSDSVAKIEYSDNKSCENSTDQGVVDWYSNCCSPPIKSRFDDVESTVLDWDWTRNEEEESQWYLWNVSERHKYAYVM